MEILRIEGLCKSYVPTTPILKGLDLTLAEGEVCSIVGESGIGKSTLLEVIAGLEMADEGTITLNGKVVDSAKVFVPAEKRKVGFLFQDFALFPHLTIGNNISFGIGNRRDRSAELLALVGLSGFENRYPHQLSGGEQQRVALARALAPNPNILLLDEPFSNLDPSRRIRLRDYLFEIIRASGVSCIFVTHDAKDAMAVADRIGVLHHGHISQINTPQEMFLHPRSKFIARFFGEINLLAVEDLYLFGIKSPVKGSEFGIRPEHITCKSKGLGTKAILQDEVFSGNYRICTFVLETGSRVKVRVFEEGLEMGSTVLLSIEGNNLVAFE